MGHCKYQYNDSWKHDEGEFGGRRGKGNKKIMSKYTRRYNCQPSAVSKGVKDGKNHSRESKRTDGGPLVRSMGGERSNDDTSSLSPLSISRSFDSLSLGSMYSLSDKERKHLQKAQHGKSRQRKYSFDDCFDDQNGVDDIALALSTDNAYATKLKDSRERSNSLTSCDSKVTSVSNISSESASSYVAYSAATSKPIPLLSANRNNNCFVHPMGSYFATGKLLSSTNDGLCDSLTPKAVADGIRSPPTPNPFLLEPPSTVSSPLRLQQGNVSLRKVRDKNSNYIPKMVYQRLFSYQHYFNRCDTSSIAPVDERWFQSQLNANLSSVESADFVVRNAYAGNVDDVVSDHVTVEVISSFTKKLFHEDQATNAGPSASVLNALYKTSKNVCNKDGKSIRRLILESILTETTCRVERAEMIEESGALNNSAMLTLPSSTTTPPVSASVASIPDMQFSYSMAVKSRSNSLIDEPELSNVSDNSSNYDTPELPSPQVDSNTYVIEVLLFITRQECTERSTIINQLYDSTFLFDMGDCVSGIIINLLKLVQSPIDSNFSHVDFNENIFSSKVIEIIHNSIECFDTIDLEKLARGLCDDSLIYSASPARSIVFSTVSDFIISKYDTCDEVDANNPNPQILRLKDIVARRAVYDIEK